MSKHGVVRGLCSQPDEELHAWLGQVCMDDAVLAESAERMDIGTSFFSWRGIKMEVYVIISIIFWFIFVLGVVGFGVTERYKKNTGSVTLGVIIAMIPVGFIGGLVAFIIGHFLQKRKDELGAEPNVNELGAKTEDNVPKRTRTCQDNSGTRIIPYNQQCN